MHHLTAVLYGVLPRVTPQGRLIISALVGYGGRIAPASTLAAEAGLRNRHHLARLLEREGLPRLELLAGWINLIAWTIAWEEHGTTLADSALGAGRDPACCYRTVKRVSGLTWGEVQRRGLPWILLQLHERCLRIPVARRRKTA